MTEERRIDGELIEFVLDRRGDELAVVFHGAHMRADLQPGYGTFLDAGLSVLHPSRPGYGRTPLTAGPQPAEFADRVAALCRSLGFTRVCAVGFSSGGRTAMALAARHPDLVHALVLESSICFSRWPAPRTRVVAKLIFDPRTEWATWAVGRAGFRFAPGLTLRFIMRSLSTLPAARVVAGFTAWERTRLTELFRGMRSSRGFANDLRDAPDITGAIHQETLILASRHDRAVPPAHLRELAERLPTATFMLVDAQNHFLSFGPGAQQERVAVHEFLASLGADSRRVQDSGG